jgi:hypothetical protein
MRLKSIRCRLRAGGGLMGEACSTLSQASMHLVGAPSSRPFSHRGLHCASAAPKLQHNRIPQPRIYAGCTLCISCPQPKIQGTKRWVWRDKTPRLTPSVQCVQRPALISSPYSQTMLGSADAITNEASASMYHTYRRGTEQIGLLPRVAEFPRQKNGSSQARCVNSACMHAFQYLQPISVMPKAVACHLCHVLGRWPTNCRCPQLQGPTRHHSLHSA